MLLNKMTNKFISVLGSLMIFVLYFIMKTVSIKLMDCLRYKTTTSRMVETRSIVTNISMFQLILLIMMPKYENDRVYSYANAKAVASAVLITYTLSPIAELAVEVALQAYRKWRFKSGAMSTYFDAHAGPEFKIHWRYSLINLIMTVVTLLGFVLPFLFPLCCVAMFTIYIWQKLALAKFYRAPPSISTKFNEGKLFNSVFFF